MKTILEQHGIRDADALIAAVDETGVPLHIAAAMIEKESNGLNVYGNDRGGVYSTADPTRPSPNVVTRENYAIFEKRVLAGETSNGVGPAQITWPGFIRDAKDRGIPLWEPLPNMIYGLTLLRDYLAGDYSEASIINAGTRYNGARAYGVDLAAKAGAWLARLSPEGGSMTLLNFPSASQMHTQTFWNQLEAVFRQMRYDVYCAPSYVRAGYCAPGRHPHGKNSRHFAGRALDIGYDPASGAPESNYEKAFLDVTVRMMQARYPRMLIVWNRGPGDHRDHAHFDDMSGYPMEGRYTGISLPNGIIGYGARGRTVEEFQRGLNKHGARIVADGIFGLATYDALRKYQYARGLVPDALYGPATAATFAPPADPNKGLTVAQVKRAQSLLNQVANAGLTVDGILGAATEAATRAFQRANGLVVDGIPGAATVKRLEKALLPTLSERVAPLRISGSNRFETAAALDAFNPPNGTGVILAGTGTPDYKAAVAITGRNSNVHVFPIRGDSKVLPGAIAHRIRVLKPSWIRIAGGPTAVSDEAAVAAAQTAGIRI